MARAFLGVAIKRKQRCEAVCKLVCIAARIKHGGQLSSKCFRGDYDHNEHISKAGPHEFDMAYFDSRVSSLLRNNITNNVRAAMGSLFHHCSQSPSSRHEIIFAIIQCNTYTLGGPPFNLLGALMFTIKTIHTIERVTNQRPVSAPKRRKPLIIAVLCCLRSKKKS